MTDREYYRSELSRLKLSKDNYVNMKLYSDDGETKYLGLNKDSLLELLDLAITQGVISKEDIEL